MTLYTRTTNTDTTSIVIIGILCLFILPTIPTKNPEMELMMSMYIRENLEARVFQNGGERRTYAQQLLENERINADKFGIRMTVMNDDQIARIQPPQNENEKTAQEFQIIQYLLTQPEMNDVTQFSPEEERCLVLRRFVSSLPFSNTDLDHSDWVSSISNEYEIISYRELTLKLLTDPTLFAEGQHQKVLQDMLKLAKVKAILVNAFNEMHLDTSQIARGNSEGLHQTAADLIQQLVLEKYEVLAQFSEAQANMIEQMDLASGIGEEIRRNSYDTELAAQVYLEAGEFHLLIASSDDPDLILEHDFMKDKMGKLTQLKSKIQIYLRELKALAQIKGIRDYLNSQIVKTPDAQQDAQSLLEEANQSMLAIKQQVFSGIHQTQKALYTIMMKDENYKQFLNAIDGYKDLIAEMSRQYDSLNNLNHRIDRLQFLTVEDQRVKGADIIMGMDLSMLIEREILTITHARQAYNQIVQLNESSPEIQTINAAFQARQTIDSERFELLNRGKQALAKINELESRVDKTLAMVFSRAMTLINQTGDSQNRMA